MEATHRSFAFMIILAQCLAMFPVSGVEKKDHRNLCFKWRSFKVYLSLIVICLLFINCGFQVFSICVSDSSFGSFVTLLFFLCGVVTAILFFKLAMDWPKIMERWSEIDVAMSSYKFPKDLKRKMHMFTVVIMAAAIIEHSLFLTFGIVNSDESLSGFEAFQVFLEFNLRHVFRYVRFNICLGLLLQLINIQMTFSWNYMDLFVILVSLSLAARFNQVAKRIKQFATLRVIDDKLWMAVREDYDRLKKLCVMVDDSINNITLLSFSNNFFVILVQLFNSLKPNFEGVTGRIYFIYSFGFLIIKTTAVSLIAARVDSKSREPVNYLISLPYYAYNAEVDRLLCQIKSEASALTGRKLFSVTKSLVLSIAGAMVTYELILIQFTNIKNAV